MNQIKNLSLLGDFKPEDIDLMEQAALMHRRHNNINFKIINVLPKKVIIQALQGKNSTGKYFQVKELIRITRETFSRFFPGKVMDVHATVYTESPVNVVDPKWINDKMEATGTKLKDIAQSTGIDKTQLSTLINGSRPLSQPMKALFWYYFSSSKQKL